MAILLRPTAYLPRSMFMLRSIHIFIIAENTLERPVVDLNDSPYFNCIYFRLMYASVSVWFIIIIVIVKRKHSSISYSNDRRHTKICVIHIVSLLILRAIAVNAISFAY